MKKQIKTILIGSLATLLLGTAITGVSLNKENTAPAEVKATSPYTLTMSSGLTWSSGDVYTKSTTAGTTFNFNAYQYTTQSSYFGDLSSGGTIANTTLINGITTVSVTLTSGTVIIHNGYTPNGTDIAYATTGTTITGANSGSLTMDGDYFEIEATAASVIASVTIEYSCVAPTTVSKFRITVAKPSIATTTDVYDSNYVWINTNIKAVGTWSNYVMTEDTDGTWYYDFTDVSVLASGFTFTLLLCDSKTTFTWNDSYKSSNYIGYGFGVYAGCPGLTYTTTPAFSAQPPAVTTTYDLTLTINMTTPSGTTISWGNMQIVYNYDNSTSSYTWNGEFAWATASSYSRTISSLNSSSTLYFKVYMYTDSSSHYIGGTSGANFTITPSGSTAKSSTIAFTYDSASSAIVGEQS